MDPYSVLGVQPDADEETIKRAYKELVKKYHPDKYVNNPLADLAAEKMKEINKAYDAIMNKNKNASGGSGYTDGYSGGYSAAGSADASFAAVRMMIDSGRYGEAEKMLASLPQNAEWYYLSGVMYMRRGWTAKGMEYLNRAVSMDPNNMEYRSARDNMNNRGTVYRQGGGGQVSSSGCCGGSPCDCCANLLCADCCCECMGGDLITCC